MTVKCGICPNNCIIKNGKSGLCGVRSAADGRINLPYYGLISAASADPIEKKPLYHFHPGKSIFSIGFFGCSLACPFCQNHRISKDFNTSPDDLSPVTPADIAARAKKSGSFGIAFTYSEPIVHFEYVIKTAEAARALGLKTVLVTNGYINENKGIELLKYIDAVNIDLKSFSDDFYRMELKGQLKPVLNFIENSVTRTHTEITTLVIPGKNASIKEISSAAGFIAELGRNIPYHLSAYYPAFKYRVPATLPSALIETAEAAKQKLNFVYTGNIYGGLTDTACPDCGNLLISRTGYQTEVTGFKKGKCSGCGASSEKIGIVL